MMRRCVAALVMLAGLAGIARGEGVSGEALRSAAQATVKRFETDGAAWLTLLDMRQGVVVEMDTMARGERRRVVVSAVVKGKKTRFAEIVSRDGFDYVTVEGRKEKFRSFEADFSGVRMYAMLEYNVPATFAEMKEAGTLAAQDGVVVMRSPLQEPMRQQVKEVVETVRKMMAANPEKITAETRETMTQLEDLLTNGVETRYSEKTGVRVRASNVKMKIETLDFRFLTAADDKVFDVKAGEYTDRTGPLAARMDDVVLIGHMASWRPGQPVGDFDYELLDLRSGNYRRAPFAGGSAGPGCFSGDRRTLWVTGFFPAGGNTRIVEIDLKTGANKIVGGALASSGFNLFPALSRDGKHLCFGHKEFAGDLLGSQVVVVELASGKEAAVGEPGDYGVATWAAGDLLVLPVREKVDVTKPDAGRKRSSKICKMDLRGRLTELVDGTMSAVVGDGRTILFEEEKVWKVCDLEGKNIRVLGDGLKGLSFPTAAPDGKRVLMMDYSEAKTKGPQPVVVWWETGKVERVAAGGGFWASPSWR